MIKSFHIVFIFSLVVSGYVVAADRLTLNASNDFYLQRERILQELQGKGVYANMQENKKHKVLAALDQMKYAVDMNNGSVDTLSERSKVEFFNQQELVNSILSQADGGDRVICRRERRVGSNMPINKCMTVAEMEKQRQAAKDAAIRHVKAMMPDGRER